MEDIINFRRYGDERDKDEDELIKQGKMVFNDWEYLNLLMTAKYRTLLRAYYFIVF